MGHTHNKSVLLRLRNLDLEYVHLDSYSLPFHKFDPICVHIHMFYSGECLARLKIDILFKIFI